MTAVVDTTPVRDAPRAPQAPVDTSVVIPEAVRRAAERAENYYKQQPVEAALEAPAAPAAGDPAPQPVEQVEPPEQVTAPVTPPAAPEAPEAPQPSGDDASWEHKFKSQQGRVNAQNSTIRQLQEQLSDVSNELVQMQRFVEQTQAQQNAQPQQRLITDEDESTYGEDFINVARKAAREVVNPEVEGLRNQVASLNQSLQQTAQRNLYAALDTQVPNWRVINRHPTFIQWLGLRDPMSGAIRRVLLDGAFRAADAARVATIFKGFVADDAASRPADPASLTPPPAPVTPAPARQPVVSLETLAAPGRARSVPAHAATTEKSTYTTRTIAKFYDDVRKGLYAGRDAEKMAREHDIFAAQREGRVIG